MALTFASEVWRTLLFLAFVYRFSACAAFAGAGCAPFVVLSEFWLRLSLCLASAAASGSKPEACVARRLRRSLSSACNSISMPSASYLISLGGSFCPRANELLFPTVLGLGLASNFEALLFPGLKPGLPLLFELRLAGEEICDIDCLYGTRLSSSGPFSSTSIILC